MPTVETAAVAAGTFAALYASHLFGDHVVQHHRDAEAKAAPRPGQILAGAHPWRGWAAIANHICSYIGVQVVVLLFVAVTVIPLTFPGLAAAVLVSASTHAVIDRRWLVWRLIRAKGAYEWTDGPALVDQALHTMALLVAAVLAACVGDGGAALTLLASGALVAGALVYERHAALTASPAVDPERM